MRVDKTVRLETTYIALGMAVMSVLMHAVFLAIGKWSFGVLYSNLLVGGFMVLNFFLLGLTVQKATEYDEEKKAKNLMKLSQSLRFLALGAVLAVGALLSNIGDRTGPFEFWALIPPVFFNRITIMIRGFALRKEGENEPRTVAPDEDESEGAE